MTLTADRHETDLESLDQVRQRLNLVLKGKETVV